HTHTHMRTHRYVHMHTHRYVCKIVDQTLLNSTYAYDLTHIHTNSGRLIKNNHMDWNLPIFEKVCLLVLYRIKALPSLSPESEREREKGEREEREERERRERGERGERAGENREREKRERERGE